MITMSMKDFMQNEYELYCTGKLLVELILTDSFHYLLRNKLIDTSMLKSAFDHATDYRRQVLRKYVNQDGVRATSYVPVSREEQRKTEFRIRVWVAKQMMVSWWYDEQKKNGVKKLFLELPVAV